MEVNNYCQDFILTNQISTINSKLLYASPIQTRTWKKWKEKKQRGAESFLTICVQI